MDPIKTTSGKTAREHIKVLRDARPARDHTDMLIEKLDALAEQAYSTIRMMRKEGNALRLMAIDAKRVAMLLKKKPPAELDVVL